MPTPVQSIPVQLNIVIVCYNCGREICRLLEDIADGDLPLGAIGIIVVDNASADDSCAMLQALSSLRIQLIRSERNLGFAAGCNLGVAAIANPAPILFLNPDVRLQHDSLTNLLAFAAENPLCGLWGGSTCNAQGERDGKSAWREPGLLDLLCWCVGADKLLQKTLGRTSGGYSRRELRNDGHVDAVSGCFLLIEQRLFRQLNGFDEDFFLYSEEIDLCRRARALGARPRVTERAVIMHAGSQTLNGISKLDHQYRSKLRYFRKHGPRLEVELARVLIAVGAGLRFMVFAALTAADKQYGAQRELWRQFLKIQREWSATH